MLTAYGLDIGKTPPDRSYAVGSKRGVYLDNWPDSPPAGRYRTSLFQGMFAQCANIPWKR